MPESAPGPLQWIEELVNTRSIEFGTDDLADPAALVSWLAARDLVDPVTRATAADLRRALRLREGLRALVARNNDEDDDGEGLDPAALEGLVPLAQELPLVLDITPDPPALVPLRTSAVDWALTRIVAAVPQSVGAGTWRRLKVCREPGCRWAYYDLSRNRSRAWCDMSACGNRAKARSYRQRSR